MHWLKKSNHLIAIWCNRPNDLAVKIATENWLELNEIPYDRLLFDRPDYPIFVNETPANAKYFNYDENVSIIAELFEEWKKCITENSESQQE